MPSPFPGMDPYLEDPGLWPDVHQTSSRFQALLASQLRPKYRRQGRGAGLHRRRSRRDVSKPAICGFRMSRWQVAPDGRRRRFSLRGDASAIGGCRTGHRDDLVRGRDPRSIPEDHRPRVARRRHGHRDSEPDEQGALDLRAARASRRSGGRSCTPRVTGWKSTCCEEVAWCASPRKSVRTSIWFTSRRKASGREVCFIRCRLSQRLPVVPIPLRPVTRTPASTSRPCSSQPTTVRAMTWRSTTDASQTHLLVANLQNGPISF